MFVYLTLSVCLSICLSVSQSIFSSVGLIVHLCVCLSLRTHPVQSLFFFGWFFAFGYFLLLSHTHTDLRISDWDSWVEHICGHLRTFWFTFKISERKNYQNQNQISTFLLHWASLFLFPRSVELAVYANIEAIFKSNLWTTPVHSGNKILFLNTGTWVQCVICRQWIFAFNFVAIFAIPCCCVICGSMFNTMLILYLLYNVDSSLVMDSFRNDNGSNICL